LSAGFCLYDSEDRLVLCNQRYREIYPKHADALVVGRLFEEMLREGVERGEFSEAIGREEEWIAERLRYHQDPEGPIEQQLSDGRWLRIEERRTADGGVAGLRTDITDLKLLQQALKENEERFRDFTEASADWVWEMNADLRFTYMSENVARIVGVAAEWHYGKTRENLLGDDYDRAAWDHHLQALRDRKPFRNFEFMRVGEGIEPRWLRTSGVPRFGEDGAFLGYRGTGSDVTEQRNAEEKLRASEIRLLHAQKTESIGRLTGGVAHDFNNLLAVIQGNLELIEERLTDPELKSMIGAALRSVARGAKLTGQLLMFGRKALLAPEVIDLNATVEAMGDLIRRTLPASIMIVTRFAEGLRPTRLDQNQLEAAVLNVIINAKDAMADGGRLAIETANVTITEEHLARFDGEFAAGSYVMLAVSDTGHGMDAETQARAFEPFFTTKPIGRGSGLGLSMVKGFAQHSGGDALIEGEAGRGTTVRLYFPACCEPLRDEVIATHAGLLCADPGDSVLVVEDQAEVRKVVAGQLANLGYRVLEAADGASALAVLQSSERIDVLLTDVVMPGKPQGPAIAEEARALRPGIGVILMTGYPRETMADSAWVGSPPVCLRKPIAKRDLAREVWKQIHGRPTGDGATPSGDRR
jgi:PAS domain S-box-containing protein